MVWTCGKNEEREGNDIQNLKSCVRLRERPRRGGEKAESVRLREKDLEWDGEMVQNKHWIKRGLGEME